MKYIFLNLKRFDVPAHLGGVNRVDPISWAADIIRDTLNIRSYSGVEFAAFFPEAHLINAVQEKRKLNSPFHIGCQSIFREDVHPGKNFGAFTTNRPAASMQALGVDYTIIGHCEERRDKTEILAEANCTDKAAVNRLLNKQVKSAIQAGIKVLYCIGETAEEQENKFNTLEDQLKLGLEGVDLSKVVIAYEPVWAIGPGKTPPDADYIRMIARFIKSSNETLPVVYGGGLKTENAAMLAGIAEIDGGLIALTRFTGEIGFYPEEFLEIVSLYLL
jgi:triosephosphate isomerase